MKPNQAEGELPPHAHNAAPKPPKGRDEYSGHLPQVTLLTNLYTSVIIAVGNSNYWWMYL